MLDPCSVCGFARRTWVRAHGKRCRLCYLDARRAAYAHSDKARKRAAGAAWRATTNGKQAIADAKLRHRYGITTGIRSAMLEQQGGRCLICQRSERLVVDHDHATGVVRGLLCTQCNHLLGNANDDTTRLCAAIAYLEKTC